MVLFVIVGIMLLVKGTFFPILILGLPLLILYHTLFNFSLGMLLGASNVYYRDTQHLLGVVITAWFFMSPAMYNLELLAPVAEARPHLMDIYMLNPLAGVLTRFCDPDELRDARQYVVGGCVCLGAAHGGGRDHRGAGNGIYRRREAPDDAAEFCPAHGH